MEPEKVEHQEGIIYMRLYASSNRFLSIEEDKTLVMSCKMCRALLFTEKDCTKHMKALQQISREKNYKVLLFISSFRSFLLSPLKCDSLHYNYRTSTSREIAHPTSWMIFQSGWRWLMILNSKSIVRIVTLVWVMWSGKERSVLISFVHFVDSCWYASFILSFYVEHGLHHLYRSIRVVLTTSRWIWISYRRRSEKSVICCAVVLIFDQSVYNTLMNDIW